MRRLMLGILFFIILMLSAGCFQKAPDAGKACASNADCMSVSCDLESAIKSGKCTLVNKEVNKENENFFTVEYSCVTDKPGECAAVAGNVVNPGGISHYCKMEGETLIETQEQGNIY